MQKKDKYSAIYLVMLLVSFFCMPKFLFGYDNIITHPHIAKQAFYIWPNDTSHEIYQYLGMNYYDTSTGDSACESAKTGWLIAEGAKEEDDYDPLGKTCNLNWHNAYYGFYHHYFNPYIPDPNGLQNELVGYVWHGALWQAQTYWLQAKILYSIEPINKPLAYWYLGRIAHLLADVSVPAHVLNDSHGIQCVDGQDSYELFMMLNFLNYSSNRVTDFDQLPISLTLDDMFNQSALHTATYPSDNVDGKDASRDSWNNNIETCYSLEYNFYGIERYISDNNLNTIASDLVPQAIKYTAALYRAFWREFHADIEGLSQFDIFTTQTFSVFGKQNGAEANSWEWDFDVDGYYDDASDQTVSYTFKQLGDIAIKVRLNGDPNLIITKQIHVIPPKIAVEFPNGFEDLYRQFSIPENSLIKSYAWNFGDGVIRTDDDYTTSHTYTTSGYYTVTLTLTLDDNSTIQSQAGIFVGPGTRYIQGHTIYGDETWDAGATYVVQGGITIAQGGRLTIESGAEVKFYEHGAITASGTLIATGVKFTAQDQAVPYGGINFFGAGSKDSRLENCVLEYGNGNYNGSVIYIDNTSPTIKGCTIDNSGGSNGIYIQNGSPIIQDNTINGINGNGIYVYSTSSPTVTGNTIINNQYGIYVSGGGGTYQGNTFSGNTEYGISVAYDTDNPVFSGNTYSNNVKGDLRINGTIRGAAYWDETGIYNIGSLNISEGAGLTIISGRTVKFYGLGAITASGTLIATGVKFTAQDQAVPYGGINFFGAGSKDSRLENCVLEYGNGNYNGSVIYIDNTSPTIKGCTIDNSGGSNGIYIHNGLPVIQDNTINGINVNGIYVDSSSSPTVTGNTITNNQYGIYVSGGGTYQGNTIKDNSSYGLYYSGTSVIDATNCNWGDPSGPYDPSDDRASGGLYNPNCKGDKVSNYVNYDPWKVLQGDVNLDGTVNLVDALLALQVFTGKSPSGTSAYVGADVNGDGKIGLPEAIYILQKVAGMR